MTSNNKRDNSPEYFKRGKIDRSLLGKQGDQYFTDTLSQKVIQSCEQELLSNKIKVMLKSIVSKEKSNTSLSHGKQLIEQKRNASSRDQSLNPHQQQPPLNCFSFHFPRTQNMSQNQQQQQYQPEILSARQATKPDKNELYYLLNKNMDRDRAISQYLSQRKELSQPKNDAVKPNYLQYLQEIKSNFETIRRHNIYTPRQTNQHANISSSSLKRQKQTTPSPNARHKSNDKIQSPRNVSNEKPVYQNQQQSTVSTNASEDNYSNLQCLSLQKEEIINQMQRKSLEKITKINLAPLLEKYLKIVMELCKSSQSLQKIDKNITQSLYLDLLGILIFYSEKIPPMGCHLDINKKNLIQYLGLTSLFVIEKLLTMKNSIDMQSKMQSRVNERQKDMGRKSTHNRLQKNNDIELINFSLDSIEDSDCPEQFTKVLSNENVEFSQRVNNIMSCIRVEVFDVDYTKNPQTRNESQLTFVSVSESEKVNSVPPYLNKMNGKQYTLVLDLDETLVHYQELEEGGGQFLVRPYAEGFLLEMSKYYELVIFTASLPDYANFILDIIDKKKSISYRLYRQHTKLRGNIHLKDLSRLGRAIQKIIIVDNLPENFQLQPDNGIFIQSWMGDLNDRALKDLSHLLIGISYQEMKEIVKKKCKDVRYGLKVLREQMFQRVQNGSKDPYSNLSLAI